MSAAPAADHVLRMLALLSHHPEPVSAGLVAATLRLPRSTTYRLLSVLVDHGFVHYLPEERRYGLSAVAQRARLGLRASGATRIARPIVRQLVDRMKENAHLAVLHGRDVLYAIEERAAGRPMLGYRCRSSGCRRCSPPAGSPALARLPAAQVRALFRTRQLSLRPKHGRPRPAH